MNRLEKIVPLFLEDVDSTNLFAKKNIDSFDRESLNVISASYQTGGLGTNKRVWQSQKEENVLATFVFPYDIHRPIHQYGQVLSVAIIEFLESLNIQAHIKWPNDILINERKLAGILAQPDSTHQLMILGLGLNVNLKDSSMIDQLATSLFLETQKNYNVAKILEQLTSFFLEKLNLYHSQGFDKFISDYVNHLAYIDKQVEWNNEQGYIRSVSLEGYLLFEDEHHQIHEIRHGSIHVNEEKY